MKTIYKILAVASVAILAGVAANAEESASGDAAAPSKNAPIPTLHCDFKAMSACTPDGDCKEGDQVAGIKVPIKATVDFENSVVSAVDDTGYARTDKFDTLAESGDQLIIHGIDGPFGWQLILSKTNNVAAMSFASADTLIGGFGTCTAK